MSLNEVIAKLRELLGTEGDISYGPARVGDVPLSLADIDKARDRLGYEPRVPALEGLELVASWYGRRSRGD
jgi:UDP-N-acetylglucosamine 4-epimerase